MSKQRLCFVKKEKKGSDVAVTFHFNPEAIFTVVSVVVLAAFIVAMCWFGVSSVIRAAHDAFEDIDTSLLTVYNDENLNCMYYIPGTTWEMAEMDMTELQDTVAASAGEGGSFSLRLDPLEEEVLSLLCFNDQGASGEGYRQFMTFSFRAMPTDVEPSQFGSTVTGSNTDKFNPWISYCEASFQNDMFVAGYEAEILDSQILSDSYGVLMHTVVEETVTSEDGEGTTTEPLYYTQFMYPIAGKNIGIVTFGSITEDASIDNYLAYMLVNGIYY